MSPRMRTAVTVRGCVWLVVDVGVGLLLAGAVAPLVLVVLPGVLRGRAFLVVVSAACIMVSSLFRRCAARRR